MHVSVQNPIYSKRFYDPLNDSCFNKAIIKAIFNPMGSDMFAFGMCIATIGVCHNIKGVIK